MSDNDLLNLEHLSEEQLRYLVELLWADRNAIGMMCQAHIDKVAAIPKLPQAAAEEVINLAACFNDLSRVGAETMKRIRDGALGALN